MKQVPPFPAQPLCDTEESPTLPTAQDPRLCTDAVKEAFLQELRSFIFILPGPWEIITSLDVLVNTDTWDKMWS